MAGPARDLWLHDPMDRGILGRMPFNPRAKEKAQIMAQAILDHRGDLANHGAPARHALLRDDPGIAPEPRARAAAALAMVSAERQGSTASAATEEALVLAPDRLGSAQSSALDLFPSLGLQSGKD